jgi:hypothetical protein
MRNTITLTLVAFGCSSCAAPQAPPPTKPECSDAQLAKIEAAYIAEAAQACAGSTYDDCGVLEEIRQKYARKRAEWTACK